MCTTQFSRWALLAALAFVVADLSARAGDKSPTTSAGGRRSRGVVRISDARPIADSCAAAPHVQAAPARGCTNGAACQGGYECDGCESCDGKPGCWLLGHRCCLVGEHCCLTDQRSCAAWALTMLNPCGGCTHSPDFGWSPPVEYPVLRNPVQYRRYWPTRWYGAAGSGISPHAPQFPMVHMPTDTTQLGFYYQRTPQWQPNPAMIPPAPWPANYHHRLPSAPCRRDCCGCASCLDRCCLTNCWLCRKIENAVGIGDDDECDDDWDDDCDDDDDGFISRLFSHCGRLCGGNSGGCRLCRGNGCESCRSVGGGYCEPGARYCEPGSGYTGAGSYGYGYRTCDRCSIGPGRPPCPTGTSSCQGGRSRGNGGTYAVPSLQPVPLAPPADGAAPPEEIEQAPPPPVETAFDG